MSLREDFMEALRSVKRDFFRENEYTDRDSREPAAQPPLPSDEPAQPPVSAAPPPAEPESYVPPVSEPTAEQPPVQPDRDVYAAYRQAASIEDTPVESDDEASYTNGDGNGATPYRSFDPDQVEYYDQNRDDLPPRYTDFDDNGVFGDDKTIISKGTVIRGELQTEDSLRLLGQILGDIECKSNIVVAGKVRGNTTAANAYIYDAQVDGDVRCDDAVNVSNDAWVLGNIRAQQAEIEGKIKGNIEIRHSVSIGATSSILGDISADELEIKRGAFVNGQIMMYSPQRDVLDRFDSFEE